MQIKLLDQDHLEFGPVTVDLARNHILALPWRQFARDPSGERPASRPRTTFH
jgi:hypothetical protein